MFAKRTLLVVPLILVFCLIGCSNPSGSDDTTYSIDAYEISESCYQYLMAEMPYAEDALAYVESHEGTVPHDYYSDNEYTIEGFQEVLRDLRFEEEFISEYAEILHSTDAIAVWYDAIDNTYWMLYSERIDR